MHFRTACAYVCLLDHEYMVKLFAEVSILERSAAACSGCALGNRHLKTCRDKLTEYLLCNLFEPVRVTYLRSDTVHTHTHTRTHLHTHTHTRPIVCVSMQFEDSAGRSDEDVAEEAMNYHSIRSRSCIHDVLQASHQRPATSTTLSTTACWKH